jgi:polysaccharide export outer membrane protein
VSEDGVIVLDTTGSIKVAQLTVEAAAALITKQSSGFLNNPVVTVSLKDSEKPYFVVAGEVDKPGKYDLRNPITALQAILVAGGMTSTARSGQVIVYHIINDTDAEVTVLNLSTIRSKKGLKRDVALEQGDMVFVPRSRLTEVERVVKLANIGIYFNPLGPF